MLQELLNCSANITNITQSTPRQEAHCNPTTFSFLENPAEQVPSPIGTKAAETPQSWEAENLCSYLSADALQTSQQPSTAPAWGCGLALGSAGGACASTAPHWWASRDRSGCVEVSNCTSPFLFCTVALGTARTRSGFPRARGSPVPGPSGWQTPDPSSAPIYSLAMSSLGRSVKSRHKRMVSVSRKKERKKKRTRNKCIICFILVR